MSARKRQPRPGRWAASGRYGAIPHDRVAVLAGSLLGAIEASLDGADYFTREDMLHLDVFDHVSTISRYRLLCYAVEFLLRNGSLVEKSRTDFCLPGRSRSYPGGAGPLADSFGPALKERIAAAFRRSEQFTTGDAVKEWTTDNHLTGNVKRLVVRRVLAEMVKAGALRRINENAYAVGKGTE